MGVGWVLISLSMATHPIDGYTTKSITPGQCDTRPTVTFPATEHHRTWIGTKLYSLVTEAHGCEQELLLDSNPARSRSHDCLIEILTL